MDLNAAPRELSTEVTKDHQVVGAHQDMHDLRDDGKGFEMVELIQQFWPSCGFGNVFSFIDQNGIGLAMFERLLKDQAQSCCICPSFPGKRVLLHRLPCQNRHLSAVIDGILNVWFLQEEQRTLIVVTPL